MSRRSGQNISTLARATGLKRHEVKTLVKEHGIPHEEHGNLTIVLSDGLPRLMEIIARFPGVDPSFAALN